MSRKVLYNHIIDLSLISDSPFIIDAGTNRGEYIDFLLKQDTINQPTIIGIECIKGHVDFVNSKNIPNITILNKALSGTGDGKVTFTEFSGKDKSNGSKQYNQWSNILGNNKDYLSKIPNVDIKEYEIDLITIQDIINEYNVDKIDYIKMDIEGAEYSIINNMTQELADKISQISMETHQPNKNPGLIKKLNNLGFKVEEHKGLEIYAYRV